MMETGQRKGKVRHRANLKLLFRFFQNGIRKAFRNRHSIIISVILIIILVSFYIYRFKIIGFDGAFALLFDDIYTVAYIIICFFGILSVITIFGMPKGYFHYYDSFIRINCYNQLGEPPALVDVRNSNDGANIFEWTFECPGLPLTYWVDHKDVIESTLNVHIVDIFNGQDNQHIICEIVPGNQQLKKMINWHNDFLSNNDFELVLGEGYNGKISIDLNISPHMLIGGATGSGKTVLMRCLLAQGLAKGADIIIADFKKVDFKKIWHKTCLVITDEDVFISVLHKIIAELEHRQQLYQACDCSNLEEYNKKHKRKLQRIIIGCDEVAELLDAKGADKSSKAKIDEISKAFSTIARQGRAFGISLILGTQRASVDVIPAHVKSNLTYTTCGRASTTLSVIILDNGDAADKIPKKAKGRFLDNEGRLYQAYYFEDSQLPGLLKEKSNGKRKKHPSF